MALSRVQATPKATATSAGSVAVTFGTPPTVGNAIVVGVTSTAGATPLTGCTDNRGNPYTLAKGQGSGSSGNRADIFVCAAVTTTGAPVTVTITGSTRHWQAVALEVSGVGSTGLALDQSAAASTAASPYGPGSTPALTVAEVLLVAATGIGASSSSITVVSVSPPWIDEAESLASTPLTGEVDSRILTGALGTTQSVTWTLGGGAAFAESVLVALKATGAAGPTPVADTFTILPV